MRKILVVVMACVAVISLVEAPPAHAFCGFALGMGHGGGYFNCVDYTMVNGTKVAAQVASYSYQLNSPTTVNTGTQDILCEEVGVPDPDVCNNPTAGTGTDGVVTLTTDWSYPSVVGCPVAGTTANRVVILVQAADGTGLIASINGSSSLGYNPDLAGFIDTGARDCGTNNARPAIVGSSVSGGNVTLALKFNSPKVYSDCDADSVGAAVYPNDLGVPCPDAGVGAVALGGIFTSNQPCGNRPDIRLAAWTRSATTPAADGSATITVPQPTAAGTCLYVGGTTNIGGFESSAITGWINYKGTDPLPASPTAENVAVAKAAGKVKVSWETLSEVGLAGFKLVAVGHKGEFQVGGLISAKGTASKYSASLSMSDFKGNKGVKVVSVLTDGTTLSSPVKNF